jgi:hypothetical protein
LSVFLFFDECVKPPTACAKGCEENDKLACKHRLDFTAEILGVDDYIRFMRFSDRQIILHCLSMIRGDNAMQIAAKSGKFFIVTRDKTFLKDAQKISGSPKRNHKNFPTLGFGPDLVECNGFKIKILEINCPSRSDICRDTDDTRCAICRLNNLWHADKI